MFLKMNKIINEDSAAAIFISLLVSFGIWSVSGYYEVINGRMYSFDSFLAYRAYSLTTMVLIFLFFYFIVLLSIPVFRENKHEFDGFFGRLFSSDNQPIKYKQSSRITNDNKINIAQETGFLNIIKVITFFWVSFVVIGYVLGDGRCVTDNELEENIDMINDMVEFHIYFLKATLVLIFLWFINFLADNLDSEYNKIILTLLFASIITNLNFLLRCHMGFNIPLPA